MKWPFYRITFTMPSSKRFNEFNSLLNYSLMDGTFWQKCLTVLKKEKNYWPSAKKTCSIVSQDLFSNINPNTIVKTWYSSSFYRSRKFSKIAGNWFQSLCRCIRNKKNLFFMLFKRSIYWTKYNGRFAGIRRKTTTIGTLRWTKIFGSIDRMVLH